ncbi:MAG: hypothetical protein FJ395_03825 [Verrucomicrobia bacterium]|nr:hypothetical protein [Verrucomicrobiota bacterium]
MKSLKLAAYSLAGLFMALAVAAGVHVYSRPHGSAEMALFGWRIGLMVLAIATAVVSFLALRQSKEKWLWIPLGIGLLPFVGIIFSPPVCMVGGIALAIWHYKTRHQPAAGATFMPVLKVLAVLLPAGMATVMTIVAAKTDFLQHDFEGYGTMVAFFVGGPMAFATAVVSFVALQRSRQKRFWVPLAIGLLPFAGFGGLLLFEFPWLLLVLAGVVVAGWLCARYWKRRQSRQTVVPQPPQPPVTLAPMLPVTRAIPVAPASPPVPPPRRRPLLNLLALALPVLAVPVCFLLGFLAEKFMDTSGFNGWAALALAMTPLILAIPVSLVLAIVSLCRRERFLALSIIDSSALSSWFYTV